MNIYIESAHIKKKLSLYFIYLCLRTGERSRHAGKSKSKKKDKRKKTSHAPPPPTSESSSNSSSDSTSSDDDDQDPGSNWNILYSIWPVERRPIALQNKAKFNEMTLNHLLSLAQFDRENAKSIESDLSSSYNRDKKPLAVKYTGAKDDGFKKLHPARFERFPLADVKDWWKKVPRVRSHQYKNLPLQFSGTHNKVTLRTIQLMHDRTKVLNFKHFHSGNINVGSKPIQKIEKRDDNGVCSSLDFNWEAPVNLAQVSDALLNYCTILLHLWPLDQTGLIILRLVNKYNYFPCANSLAQRVSLVSTFFNTVLRENAARAGSKSVPMDFTEQEEALKNILTSSGFSSTVPTGRNPNQEADKFKFNPGRTTFSTNSTAGQTRPKVLMIGSNPVCFNFNSGHCRNLGSPTGCKDQRGKEYAHLCNKWLDVKQAYCLARHARVAVHR